MCTIDYYSYVERNGCCCCPARSACRLARSPACYCHYALLHLSLWTLLILYYGYYYVMAERCIECVLTPTCSCAWYTTYAFVCVLYACTSCIAVWLYIRRNTQHTFYSPLFSSKVHNHLYRSHGLCTHWHWRYYTHTHRDTPVHGTAAQHTHTHEQYNYYFVWGTLFIVCVM